MLIAALRSDNPLGGAPLTCDEAAEHFTLQGLGEISAAKLLDLENRRQLVWADPVTREWVIETAAVRVRKAAAAKTAARAAEAAAAAAASAAASDDRARAGGIVPAGTDTLVFEPPPSRSSVSHQPAGVRAAQTRFEAPVSAAGGARRVVWSEPPDSAPAPLPSVPVPSAPAADPVASDAGAMVTRRADRRSSVKAAERRHALVPAGLATAPAVAVLVLLAVLAVVVVLLVQHGGF